MLNSLTTIFLGPYDMISQQISIFFDWLVLKGVREDTLIIILVAGGISILLLILGLLMALIKFLRKSKGKKPKKPAQPKDSKKTKGTQKSETTRVKGPDPRFSIFKKRKNKKTQEGLAQTSVTDPNVAVLTEIERDMLALKELFDAGHIDARVYVEETRKLYDKAQQLI